MEEDMESQRPKRRRLDKSGRLAALERIRNLKGKKNKYNLDEVDNVYDVVDEVEYAKKVHQQASDWIAEDEVGGYVEDGREIFDEYEEGEEDRYDGASKSTSKKRQKESKKGETKEVSQTSKLTKYFTKDQAAKKKEVNIGSDALLANILSEMDSSSKVDEVVKLKPKQLKVPEKVKVAEAQVRDVPETVPPVQEEITATEPVVIPAVTKEIPPSVTPEILKAQAEIEEIAYSDVLFEAWNETTKNIVENEPVVESKNVNASVKSDEKLTMWLWDVWEDSYKKPGHVFLFGKTEVNGVLTSTCIQITNVERCLYLLPRKKHSVTNEDVTLKDVYEEFSTMAFSLNIDEHRCKTVTKNFAFQIPDVDVPHTSEYLMVRYNGDGKVPQPTGNYKTIAYIFGCNTSATENFLIERKVKGPCWISVSNYKVIETPNTYCKLQLMCSSVSDITVLKEKTDSPPPLVMLSLNLRVIMNSHSKNEIVAISCLINKGYCIDKDNTDQLFSEHFCLISHPSDKLYPMGFNNAAKENNITKIQICDSERGLLNCFLAKVQALDPDLIVTQDAYARQLDVLCASLTSLKIPMMSRIGRLKLSNMATFRKIEEFFIGRMIADVKSSAEELLRLRSYDMNSLCKEILKLTDDKRREIYPDEIPSMYDKTQTLMELIHLTMQDNLYSLRIMYELQILPLALQITNISGNLMSGTLRGGRSERNEWLLLHAFAEKDYLVPDKARRDNRQKKADGSETVVPKKKAQYAGGLVLDPIKGFYDKFVLLMDFNSLYPSIIQEYNICFTTVTLNEDNEVILPNASAETGILPKQIRALVESRRQVKQMLAQPDLSKDLKLKYNIRQMALKLTANSMYGCLGFTHSRFYAQHIASLITLKGRDILMNTKTIVERLQYVVVYGDTDSIMVLTNSTNYDEVYEKGIGIKQTVNKAYRHVELDIDGVYKYLLLLKKKKYAAVAISKNSSGALVEAMEFKGLDIVRRDWCKFAQAVGERVLKEILSDKPMDERVTIIHTYLSSVRATLLENKVELPLLEITKQLSQPIGEYGDTAQNLPHVQVALRMNTTMNRNFKKGDVVGYVICEDGSDQPYIKRTYHLDEMKLNKTLKIDMNYYLANQVHPIVARIIEPLNETDASRIADCLGLDPKKYRTNIRPTYEDADQGSSLRKSNAERFRFCNKFVFTCQVCKKPNPIPEAFRMEQNRKVSVFEKCINPECNAKPIEFSPAIVNELILAIRSAISRFYENWLVCDDPLCSTNTKVSTHVTDKGRPICTVCKKGVLIRQFSEKDLFYQLDYYKFLLKLEEKDINDNNVSIAVQDLHKDLQSVLDKFINRSCFVLVNQNDLFRYHSTKVKCLQGTDSVPKEGINWKSFIEKAL